MSSYKILNEIYRSVFIALVIFSLSACGFKPVYSTKTVAEHPEISAVFQNIDVADIPGRSGQVLRNDLTDIMNPSSLNGEKLYRLDIKLKRDIVPLIIEKNRSITRYSLVLAAEFKLVEISSGKAIYAGASRVSGSYDALNSDYAVYMAEGDTGERIIKDMAEEIQGKLTSYFMKKAAVEKVATEKAVAK